ncbi:U1 small nuclear ribonucleoprotein C [Scaptodrosophila lebanonensis]|uniref:U1 small nuclear ribonucleoprotein C n=1 Tax=Drosophila lebanonensis TaxID=7225 RepID=A0A6J2T6K8_DROLE|nr:U1 small nuclear ribonucleoprotein C [Scaptodrosophila lebanonensis]
MPKYYCDYCDTYLTHDSPSVRKTHCTGRKHRDNVKFYYQKWMEEQAQHLIDATTAAFKAGKITNNPFASGPPVNKPAGVSIPPPNLTSAPPPRPGMAIPPYMPPMMNHPMMGPGMRPPPILNPMAMMGPPPPLGTIPGVRQPIMNGPK